MLEPQPVVRTSGFEDGRATCSPGNAYQNAGDVVLGRGVFGQV